MDEMTEVVTFGNFTALHYDKVMCR